MTLYLSEVFFYTLVLANFILELSVEVLIHIGLDTVNLKGQYFKVHVKEGDTVSKGQLLVEFDLDKIKELGYDTVIPFIVTNGAEFTNVTPKILPDSVEISLV